MGQSGVIEADKLMFMNDPPSPEKIEVVMGRCFPLSGPGSDFNAMPIPVVRKIIYKNRDGATFTQTFSDVISSENDNYRIHVSDVRHNDEQSKQECKQKMKPFVKHEASDGTRSDVLTDHASKQYGQEVVNCAWQGRPTVGSSSPKRSSQSDQARSKIAALPIDSQEMKRISSANSPRFRAKNRVESAKTPELTGREAWEETQKKKAQMRDEFFRVPYEECNREAIRGMGGRLNKSEPKLNTAAKERKKRNSLPHKRRVHFNMDDSQLEDMRKWREERRMQAAMPCIKTVARIYSLDSPSSNQHQVEYISAFDSPRAEHPVAVSLQGSPPMRTKVSRPTDLDSLQIRLTNNEGPFEQKVTSILKNKNSPSLDSRIISERTTSTPSDRLTPSLSERFITPESRESTDRQFTAEITPPSHLLHRSQNQSTISRNPNLPLNISQNTPPSTGSSTKRSHTSHQVTPTSLTSDLRPTQEQIRDHHDAIQLVQQQSQSRTRSVSPPRSLHFVQSPTTEKSDEIYTNKQDPFSSISYANSSGEYNQDKEENGRGKQQHVLQPRNFSDASVRPKEFQPHIVQPVPLPRNKTLPVKGETLLPERTVESIHQSRESERTKTYYNRRATSLDRVRMPKEAVSEHGYSLKSPGLILNHLKSPTSTSPTDQVPEYTTLQNKQCPTIATQTPEKIRLIDSSPRFDSSKLSPEPFEPKTSLNDNSCSQNPVGIIRSYTYPKRSFDIPQNSFNHDSAHVNLAEIEKESQDYHTRQTNNMNNTRNTRSDHARTLIENEKVSQDHHKRQTYNMNNSHNTRMNHVRNLATHEMESQDYYNRQTHNMNNSHNVRMNHTNCNASTGSHQSHHINNDHKIYLNQSSNARYSVTPKIGKENEQKMYSKRTVPNGRGNDVNILMTRGESNSKHHIMLNTNTISTTPRMTVKKIIVPLSSAFPLSTPVAPARSAPSPTPSCASSSCSFGSSGSSSGCFSGSPSPTPTPSPTRVRASGVPTDL